MSKKLMKELFSSGKQAAGLNNSENICIKKSTQIPKGNRKGNDGETENICWKLCRKSKNKQVNRFASQTIDNTHPGQGSDECLILDALMTKNKGL